MLFVHYVYLPTIQDETYDILDQKNLTGLAGGVREGPNIAKYGPRFWLLSPLEAPKWVQDPGNGLKSIRGNWGVFWPFRGPDFIMGKNKNANFSKRARCPSFKFFVVMCEVILQKNGTNLTTGEFFLVLTLLGNCTR